MEYLILLVLVAVAVLAAAILLTNPFASPPTLSKTSVSNSSTHLQFETLSNATTDRCAYLGDQAAEYNDVASRPNDTYFQGSCCSPMNYNHYVQQITGLKNYSYIVALPQNPYNVSVKQVKQMLNYYNITLNQTQMAVFNEASALTSDHGWCCCQCWAWFAHAGLAKYLIKTYNLDAAKVAHIIDLEDCCGG
ncbi:MAG: hypothetical protein KGH61_03595 [Candidatus Micrarchaeota archaeon]|nr:hypothetical protein [Candidatus Micrarchaeota archaeon]MDE1848007.1 hypothetical protein [Candidatus Micrarchaeota archaeon]MDE1864711.1 hypothetical protein [Candidatus Micrarchaeota archaeon]